MMYEEERQRVKYEVRSQSSFLMLKKTYLNKEKYYKATSYIKNVSLV